MACKVSVRQVGNVFNLADWLHYVDSAGIIAGRQLRPPDRRIQIGGKKHIACQLGSLIAPRGIAALGQVSWLHASPRAMVKPRRSQSFGRASNGCVHAFLPYLCLGPTKACTSVRFSDLQGVDETETARRCGRTLKQKAADND